MPAAFVLTPPLTTSPLRAAITALTRAPEPAVLPPLLHQARLTPAQAEAAQAQALRLAAGLRSAGHGRGSAGLVQGLLQEFALSSHEGVALMCLAEALLRIPDLATRDALIRDKIGHGRGVDWQRHLGQSPSMFVNAAAWGLLLTGKLVATHSDAGLGATLRRIVARGGEPLVRRGVDMAMRMMGEQFVTGETIAEALANARPREAQGFRFSYDMLGEAALTAEDAERYCAAYAAAIDAIGAASAERGLIHGPGISIKLSALHPRYARAQLERVMAELYPRLRGLALQARQHNIGMAIDAEESDRLELSLDLLERLCAEPALAGWHGIGFVVQAYQKRCPAVIDHLIDLARRSGHRLMVRLVKGAYWDSEIKRAQVDGQAGYPVYTRKVYTDVAYLACARRMLAAPDALFPQFATHNAHTMAAVQAMVGADFAAERCEFQCLHGMGEPLYAQVVADWPCRVYAPVGTHATLLAYLVRRLLENGANTSFVHRIADPQVPLAALVEDPVASVEAMAAAEGVLGAPHPAIPLPADLYGKRRRPALGLDLADEPTLAALAEQLQAASTHRPLAAPAGHGDVPGPQAQALRNPADADDRVGHVQEAQATDVAAALDAAVRAAAAWAAVPAEDRAAVLDAAAERLHAEAPRLLPLLVREAGKTWANAVAELREAIDFLRYNAAELRHVLGAGKASQALGVVVAISPWNFPLAIFTGQVAAALAAGNTVLAKPAEQTPLTAAAAVAALHAAGVPADALHLLPGRGETVGAALVADPRVQGVLFTGSTEVARLIQGRLAERLNRDGQPVTLVAETGGQNVMVVDSSALVEQAVADILVSAFDSAGQRCSALRLLCVQDEVAERLLAMLRGALRECRVGDPRLLSTDIGPVIDAEAARAIEAHVRAMADRGHAVWRLPLDPEASRGAHLVAPTLIELDQPEDLAGEVFGPVLHVLRWRRDELPTLLERVQAAGWGLTQGVHTRIDETVAQVAAASRAGNLYVNRNMVGAVVGVQPFGGEGLSGTGPKAGGPLYLLRLLALRPPQAARLAVAASGPGQASPLRPTPAAKPDPADAAQPGHTGHAAHASDTALEALRRWALAQGDAALAAACDRARAEAPTTGWHALAGPTGESNTYCVLPREAVACLATPGAAGDGDRLLQLAAVLAVGSRAVWPAHAQHLAERLPPTVRERITLAQDVLHPRAAVDAVLQHGDAAALKSTAAALAARPGPIVGLTGLPLGEHRLPVERLLRERTLSINTAAAGGNASLMTLGDTV